METCSTEDIYLSGYGLCKHRGKYIGEHRAILVIQALVIRTLDYPTDPNYCISSAATNDSCRNGFLELTGVKLSSYIQWFVKISTYICTTIMYKCILFKHNV